MRKCVVVAQAELSLIFDQITSHYHLYDKNLKIHNTSQKVTTIEYIKTDFHLPEA